MARETNKKSEATVLKEILLAAPKYGVTLFRNNVAQAWVGESRTLKNGDVLIKNPRRLHAGLCVGSSDLIGWRSSPQMGDTFAIFVAIEVKGPRGRSSQWQEHFIDRVNKSGGIAGVCRSVEDFIKLVS